MSQRLRTRLRVACCVVGALDSVGGGGWFDLDLDGATDWASWLLECRKLRRKFWGRGRDRDPERILSGDGQHSSLRWRKWTLAVRCVRVGMHARDHSEPAKPEPQRPRKGKGVRVACGTNLCNKDSRRRPVESMDGVDCRATYLSPLLPEQFDHLDECGAHGCWRREV